MKANLNKEERMLEKENGSARFIIWNVLLFHFKLESNKPKTVENKGGLPTSNFGIAYRYHQGTDKAPLFLYLNLVKEM